MPITLIEQKPTFTKKVEGEDKLAIAEMFADTLQGEGVSSGQVSTFLRLQGCTLSCCFCDTLDVWPLGNEYSFGEILDLFETNKLVDKFQLGQRLILTGGSPLKQETRLIKFLHLFQDRFGFLPIIEVENEAVLMPDAELVAMTHQWNNSPKLANSGMRKNVRVKPDVIRLMSTFHNSWFKFVVSGPEDWEEIVEDYLPYIRKDQIILMPEGATQQELNERREMIVDMAIKHQVRFSDRLHVTVWNKKTGV